MGSLKEVADPLVSNQSVRTVKEKFVDNTINPMRLHEESLGSQKTNIIT
jgi:hypothetical protein|tara:strand:+ start:304 stop:450 length:147 start_codon:yes stop_codon:yes gene_type:complete